MMPNQADGKARVGMSRKRACDIQCTIPNPESPCEWCDEHDLSYRVEKLENALAESRTHYPPLRVGSSVAERLATPSSENRDGRLQSESSPSPTIPPSATESTQSPLTSIYTDVQPTYFPVRQNPVTGVPLAQYWYSRGIPLLSDRGHQYMHSKTGQASTVENIRAASCQSNLQSLVLPVCCSNRELWHLPPKETVEELALAFFKSPFQRDFPVLDTLLFGATIEEAYGFIDGIPSLSQAHSIACVSAVLSIINHLEPSGRPLSTRDRDVYAAKAECILGHMMTMETNLVSLQTVLMLQRYHLFNAQTERAALLHATACRMICALGGHTYQPPRHAGDEVTWAERQEYHLRTLFWLCYISDKDVTLRSGQPPLLTEEYCDLTIPGNYTGYFTQLQGLGETITSNKYHFHFHGNLGLCRLKEKIHRLLFSSHAFNLSDGELILRIRQLDEDLESWRLSIPLELRPKLSIPPMQAIPAQGSYTTLDIRGAHLQLEYHHLVIAIHTTVRRCGADNPDNKDLPDDLHSVIHSSCDLSLEASRSTISFLKSSPTVLSEQEFSDIVFYANLAAVSLFIDILAHPQNTHSHTAINYLSHAINITQGLSTPTSTQGELKRIQQTNRFIMELIRLGSCAIAKAERGCSKTDDVPS
ncbi:hypothetical protein EKO27_g6832 [Xylaria grammica]|uniref:Xylanolytic transcriptional activator regulatory domain-containing protein n=1 Tax=Xylaria grammica TaxID=363999 RepID=A0A439D1J4_9PEZI|nr:hypothetical protein EKO27_g6832 [Xylaria grammica]